MFLNKHYTYDVKSQQTIKSSKLGHKQKKGWEYVVSTQGLLFHFIENYHLIA